jgi:hypothetical protein
LPYPRCPEAGGHFLDREGLILVKGKLRVLISAAVTVFAVGASSAHASYGPEDSQPMNAPGGYTQVVTAKTFKTAGGSLAGTTAGARVSVVVAKGAFAEPVQLRVLKPKLATLTSSIVKSGYKKYRAIAGVGIAASKATGEAVNDLGTKVKVKVTIKVTNLPKGAVVLRYDGAKGKYVKVSFTRSKAGLVVGISRPAALAVIAPLK